MAIRANSLINIFGGKVSHRYTGEGEDAGSGIDLRGLGGRGRWRRCSEVVLQERYEREHRCIDFPKRMKYHSDLV